MSGVQKRFKDWRITLWVFSRYQAKPYPLNLSPILLRKLLPLTCLSNLPYDIPRESRRRTLRNYHFYLSHCKTTPKIDTKSQKYYFNFLKARTGNGKHSIFKGFNPHLHDTRLLENDLHAGCKRINIQRFVLTVKKFVS